MKKRIVSMLLVLCVVLTQLPAAFAAREEPTVTGISITVDGVTYTEGNVTIKPDSTVSYTVTGTNLDQQMSYTLAHTQGVTSIMSSGAEWTVNDTNTTLTRDYSDRIAHFYRCDNFQVYYTTDVEERVYTDIYLTFDGGSEPAQITNLEFIVDGVSYTEGNVHIKPGSEMYIVVHGTKLYNIDQNYVIDTPLTYVRVECTALDTEHTITYWTPPEWFSGAVDYPISYTQDAWETTIGTDLTVTYETVYTGPPEITQVVMNVDGVSYTKGNVPVGPESTVSFTVIGENLQNVDQMQIIDTPLAYLPLHSIPLQEDGTYLYVTNASVFVGGSNYQITYTNDAWETTVPTDLYVTYREDYRCDPDKWTLAGDVQVQMQLTEDLYVDLNGSALTGTIVTNGYKVYGMDSATDEYTCDSMGSFSCVDENGNAIIPERFYTTDDGRRYMTIQTETGYTFHRFFMDITYLSLDTTVTGFGYKAEFYGDEMVQSQIESISYNLWMREDLVVSRTTEFQNNWALRLKNYDVANYGETPVHACVSMTLQDGTVLKSDTASYSMRQMIEVINGNTQDYEIEALQNIAQMIQNIQPMASWGVESILASL